MNISKINSKKSVNNLKRAGVIFFLLFLISCLCLFGISLTTEKN